MGMIYLRYGIMDIGANSICLCGYDINVEEKKFKTLFKEKIMAGLAGYIVEGKMTKEGILKASDSIEELKKILDSLNFDKYSVFATAPLRNISNTEDTVSSIKKITGIDIDVISGYDEAVLSYYGALNDIDMDRGLFIDCGGGSTEFVVIGKKDINEAVSVPIGSLKLYNSFVKKIMPSKKEVEKMRSYIRKTFKSASIKNVSRQEYTFCVGGSARAALKIASYLFGIPKGENIITASQLEKMVEFLCDDKRKATNVILKICPERVHTIITGILILNVSVQEFGSDKIIVSRFGVREGYLCQRIMEKN